MKKLILTIIAKLLYKIGQPRKDKEGNEKPALIYFDFDKDFKNDILEFADKLAMKVQELESK